MSTWDVKPHWRPIVRPYIWFVRQVLYLHGLLFGPPPLQGRPRRARFFRGAVFLPLRKVSDDIDVSRLSEADRAIIERTSARWSNGR
jgi:hypothetical protein